MTHHTQNGTVQGVADRAAPGAGAKAAHDRSKSRPHTLTPCRGGFPPELIALPQWVVWRYTWIEKQEKWDKPPLQARTGANASVSAPATWSSFEVAWQGYSTARQRLDGLGFVLLDGNGLVGVDIDSCRDPHTGEIAAWGLELVQLLDTYTELSPSGTGLRLFLRGTLPADSPHTCAYATGKVEVYQSGKYLTLTGHLVAATRREVALRPEQLRELLALVFGSRAVPESNWKGTATSGGAPGDLGDAALLDRARRARNGELFARLWEGQAGDDPSAADMALCCLLAFWTARDPERMDRLFRQSGLMRDKWDERRRDTTYGRRTVARACELVQEVYGAGAAAGPTATPPPRTGLDGLATCCLAGALLRN